MCGTELARLTRIAGFLIVGTLVGACDGGGGGQQGDGGALTPPPSLALLAGSMGGYGTSDGVGAEARFSNPEGIASDADGNLYIADGINSSIRKINSAGVVSTLAGSQRGEADGALAEARFDLPKGVATDGSGNVYVADIWNNCVRKITAAGIVSTLAGSGAIGSTDGPGETASFGFCRLGGVFPVRVCEYGDVAADASGNVYVADWGNSAIRKIDPAGVVSTFAGSPGFPGSADGTGAEARFSRPSGVATDSAGNVYVADAGNDTIRKITPLGVVSTLAGRAWESGSADGAGPDARFYAPSAVATDNLGNVYVADRWNHTIRKISPDGIVSTLAGRAKEAGSADGIGAEARFDRPDGVATDKAGNVYVADANSGAIRKVTASGVVSTLAGSASNPGRADGVGNAARFDQPEGVATDSAGYVYVADVNNSRIRRITPTGAVTTLAGGAGVGYIDGASSVARFNWPRGLSIDGNGYIYVADSANYAVRMITPGGVVSTLAGGAGWGSVDGPSTLARFGGPTGIAVDRSGNVYVADTSNNTIRKITSGFVSTLAGSAGVSGSADGAGSNASFSGPTGLTTDSTGNIYVADTWNHTIRKISPSGLVSTLAGSAGNPGRADGMGAEARFTGPAGLTADAAGNIYVADFSNSTIRKVTPAGAVTTIIGVAGRSGFTPGTLPGVLAFPRAIAIRGTTLYVTLYNGLAMVSNLQ